MTFKAWALDTAERAGSTLVQVAIVYVTAAQAIDNEFWRGLLVALVTAIANVIKAAFEDYLPVGDTWFEDMGIRVVWTFILTITGSLVSVEWLNIIDYSFWRQVAYAGIVASLAIVKAVLAKARPMTITPASLVQPPPGEPPRHD